MAALRRSKEQIRVEGPTAQTLAAFRRAAKWSAIIAMVIGYHVILGWLFQIDVLKSPWPTLSTMNMNSAICAILAGMCLYIFVRKREQWSPRLRLVVRICAGASAFIAL